MDGSKASPIVYFDEKGHGPIEHVCAGQASLGERVATWLFRERCLGLSPEGVALVERLIEDLG